MSAALMLHGCNQAEIAEHLHITTRAVMGHMRRLRQRALRRFRPGAIPVLGAKEAA